MSPPELCAQPLVGFRRWVVWGELPTPPGSLHSFRYPYLHPWPKDGLTAKCLLWPHEQVPDGACDCGIYGWYGLERYGDGWVWGMIVASGKVIEHEHGFRAERAQVKALLEPLKPASIALHDLTRTAADLYDVPVLDKRELVEYGRWFGEVREEVAV